MEIYPSLQSEREFIYRIQRNLNNEHYILKLYGKRTNKSNKGCGNDKTKQFYWMQMSVKYQLFILLFERRNFTFSLRLHFCPLSTQTFNNSSTIKYRKHGKSTEKTKKIKQSNIINPLYCVYLYNGVYFQSIVHRNILEVDRPQVQTPACMYIWLSCHA